MPTYTYYCPLCGDMDIKQSVHDPSLRSCPECGSEGIIKKFVPAGIQFKGSGFYSTDLRGTK